MGNCVSDNETPQVRSVVPPYSMPSEINLVFSKVPNVDETNHVQQQSQQQAMFAQLVQLLTGVQIIVAVDCSGSMGGHCGIPGDYRTRSQYVSDYLGLFIRQILDIDTDGIEMIFFGNYLEEYKVTSENYPDILHKCLENMGGTNTAAVIRRMFELKSPQATKTIGIIITDGSPNSEADCFAQVDWISRSVKNTTEFNINFLRIGEDRGAIQFLQALDNYHTDGDNVFDVIDTAHFNEVFGSPDALYKLLAKTMFD